MFFTKVKKNLHMLALYRLRNTKICLSSVMNNTSVTNYIQSVLAQGIRLFPGPSTFLWYSQS